MKHLEKRYQNYVHNCKAFGMGEPLPFEDWKEKHYREE